MMDTSLMRWGNGLSGNCKIAIKWIFCKEKGIFTLKMPFLDMQLNVA